MAASLVTDEISRELKEKAGVVPESVTDSVNQTLANTEEVQTHLLHFLSLSNPEVLAQLSPLQRAQSLLLLAKTISTLYTLKLRCTGVNPADHPVKSELGRLSLYQDKLERFLSLSREPLRPSTTLNYQAATRFIEHSLPDLTPEQRQNMRDISRGEGPKMKYLETVGQKRKYQSSERQSVQSAADEFLKKAARELLGNNGGMKGPLIVEISDDDEQPEQ
ncbi:nuclear nucleic acid-binding protein C1D [Quillaja saponaria]|uniref:Nuclear nucleic acid-binding protein C1D n=1 Tax=Quillaja saponaria TaxID=32244 RepID=A0AAD7LXR4_QUISA|nr:nuclear nucleic acid-binding protein C1D [Quillaja saponaria]